jgi:hypothetical protein
MLRRMATVVAATTALALAGAAPALAQDSPILVNDNVKDCEDAASHDVTIDGETLLLVQGANSGENLIVRGTVSADKLKLDVELLDDSYVITAVGIKAGAEASGGGTYIYTNPPFTGLKAPGDKAISHWFVCGKKKPTSTETPTPTPTPTETPTETPTPTPTEDGETPKPAVPTSVPAGYGQADNGSASTIGLLAFVTALAVGGAALVTRRFLKDN